MAENVPTQIAVLVSPKNKQTPFAEFEVVRTVGTCWESNLGPRGKQCPQVLVLPSVVRIQSSGYSVTSSCNGLEMWRCVETDYLTLLLHQIKREIEGTMAWCGDYVVCLLCEYLLKWYALLLLTKSLETNVTSIYTHRITKENS